MAEKQKLHVVRLSIVLCCKNVHRTLDASRLEYARGLLRMRNFLSYEVLSREVTNGAWSTVLLASVPGGFRASVSQVQVPLSQNYCLLGGEDRGTRLQNAKTKCAQLPISMPEVSRGVRS